MNSNAKPSASPSEQNPEQTNPLQSKLQAFAGRIEELSGAQVLGGPGRIDFAVQSGEQVRCEIQFQNQLLISVVMMSLDPDRISELAPWLLNLNALGKGSGGGWLACDIASSTILYHYRWGNFEKGGEEEFFAVVEAVMVLSRQISQLIVEDGWRKTLPPLS